MKLIHEEKKQGQVPIARGKVCWVDEQACLDKKLDTFIFKVGATSEEIKSFKESYKTHLKSEGFVFFADDKTFYRLKLNQRGRITEVGINYRHIN